MKRGIHNDKRKCKNEQEKCPGEEDLAEYTCHASNSQGEAEQSIQLTGGQFSEYDLIWSDFYKVVYFQPPCLRTSL